MGQDLKLSICMMAKDEEENLDRCLESIKDIADEIIFIDTGSKDKTIEIAQSYGAKIYRHPWQDDFSLHRNQSIKYATGDWLLFIDADEELFGNKEDLKTWLKSVPKEIDGLSVTLKDIQGDKVVMQYNPPKVFRNGKVKFKGIVHNRPIIKTEYIYCPELYFHHYGYDISEEKKKAKYDRTVTLLNKRLKQSKSDYQAYYYLVQMHGWMEEWEDAMRNAEHYLKNKDKMKDAFNGSIYFTAIRAYTLYLKDYDKAKQWLESAIKFDSKDLDILLAMTEYGVVTNDVPVMAQGASGYISNYVQFEQNRASMGSRFVHCYNPESLAYCTFHLGKAQFNQGIKTVQGLFEILPMTSESFQKNVNKELISFFQSIQLVQADNLEKLESDRTETETIES